MKSYIIICRSIVGVGGVELYVRNKTRYLISLGWDVNIFSFRKGEVYIQGLDTYKNRICPKLGFPSFLYSNKEKKHVLNWMLSYIHKSEEYVIESNSILLSSWAEVLAKELNAKHFLYVVDEQPQTFGLKRDFLLFKFGRLELAGITPEVIKSVVPDSTIAKPEEYVLKAFCINSIDDVDDSELHIELNNEIKIGFFGRINKPYLIPATLKLVDFIKKNKDFSFSIVYIGGSPYQKDINRINDIFKNITNADVQFTGFLCPVPRAFIEKFDFFISTAGSANALYRAGCLTISIDGYNYNPNGIMGIHTQKALNPEDEQPQMSDLLDDLVVKKLYSSSRLVRRDNYDYESFFDPHMRFVAESKEKYNEEYFEFNSVFLPLRFKILKILLIFFNPNWLQKVVDRFSNGRN